MSFTRFYSEKEWIQKLQYQGEKHEHDCTTVQGLQRLQRLQGLEISMSYYNCQT